MLLGQIDSKGCAPGETEESFRRVHVDTLRFVAENAKSAVRRKLATDELARRGVAR